MQRFGSKSLWMTACTLALSLCAPAARAEVAGGVIGCDAAGHKQAGGALIGALIGGVAGNSLDKHDRGTGTVLGAAAGAATGSFVGCRMQKNEAETTATRQDPAPPRAYAEPAARQVLADDRSDAGGGDGRFVPPGLAKKPYGMPPGQARKYALGQRLPASYLRDTRHYVSEPDQYGLRAPPAGHRWVLVDDDAYLVRSRTGAISQIVGVMSQ